MTKVKTTDAAKVDKRIARLQAELVALRAQLARADRPAIATAQPVPSAEPGGAQALTEDDLQSLTMDEFIAARGQLVKGDPAGYGARSFTSPQASSRGLFADADTPQARAAMVAELAKAGVFQAPGQGVR